MSDLLFILLGMPDELYLTWFEFPYVLGRVACQSRAVAQETTTTVSVFLIVAFTVERYVAICFPFQAKKFNSLSRVKRIICCIWIFSILIATPQVGGLFFSGIFFSFFLRP